MNRMLDCAPFSVMWLKAPSCAQLPRRVSDTPPPVPSVEVVWVEGVVVLGSVCFSGFAAGSGPNLLF